MNCWVVLLRGINVGGNNIVPMKQLAQMLIDMDCEDVTTYIQSGNVLLQHPEINSQILAEQIASKMQHTFGFMPNILLLTLSQLEQAAANNPFPEAQSDPKTLHLYFLSEQSKQTNLDTLNNFKKANESFELVNNVFYLHAPDGIGRSKLAEKVEKTLAVPTTARNWNTVSKLLKLGSKD